MAPSTSSGIQDILRESPMLIVLRRAYSNPGSDGVGQPMGKCGNLEAFLGRNEESIQAREWYGDDTRSQPEEFDMAADISFDPMDWPAMAFIIGQYFYEEVRQ
jgi:hypothetical protein